VITLAARLLSFAPITCMVACVGTGPSSSSTLASRVADGKSVVVAIENGRIEVIRDATVSGVEISAEVRCYGKDQAEADSRLQATSLVAQRDSEGKVEVSVSIPKRAGGGWINLNSDVTHITVRAADLSGIVATTSNGSISLGAFEGEAKLESSNGRIAVDGHRGPVNAETSNGSIDIKGATSVVADTSNGSIKVVLADDATGGLRLETSNGSITVDLPAAWQGTVSAETSLGSVNLSGGKVTGKGDSKSMTVGDGSKATASIETSNGSVTVRSAKQ
jgi:hypothetical protein